MKGRKRQFPAMQAMKYPLNRPIMDDPIQGGVPVGSHLQHDVFLQGKFFFMTFAFKINA